MQQTSKLGIVIDTSNAKQRLSDFTKQLNDVTRAATNMAEKVEKSLSAKGSQGASSQISGLTRETNLLGTAAQQAALMQDRLATSAAKTATAQANATKAAANAATAQNRQAASANSVAISNNSLVQSEFAVERAMNKTIATETRLQIIQNSLAGSALRLGTAQQNAAISATLGQDKLTASTHRVAAAASAANLASSKFVISQHNEATAALRTTTQLSRLATEEQRTAAATSAAAAAATRAGINLNGLARSVISVQREEAKLQADLLRTNALAERQAAAAARAAAGLNGMGDAADRANHSSRGLYGSMSKLYTVLNSGLVAVTGFGFIKMAADAQNLNNQIRLVTKSEEEYIGTKKELRKIANANYTDINTTIGLYQKSARALGNLGKSQADTLKFTNAISLAMRIGGRSAGEQSAALLQLGQAMGAGVIMGDEFRSISENAPILLSLVAKQMGVLQGDLKKLSADGKITAEIMYDAVVENEKMMQSIADGVAITMGQSWVVAKNKFKEFTDTFMNETGGVSDHISKFTLFMGDNFGAIAKIIGGVAVLALGKYITTTAAAMVVTNGLTVSALSTTGAISIYSTSVGVATGIISGFIKASTIAGTVTSRVMGLSALSVSGAFTAATGAITTATAAAGRWSTYSGVASAATGVLTGVVSVATGAFVRLATVINAHPLMALAGVLIAVVASTKDANGEMLGLSGAMSSLGDTISVIGEILGGFIGMAVEGFSSLTNSAMNMINNLITGSKDGTDKSKKSFGELFGVTETGFLGIAQGAASVFDAASLTILSFVNKAINHLGNLVVRAKNAYSSAKAFFGFGDGSQESLYETNFYSLMDQQAGRLNIGNGGGLYGAFSGVLKTQQQQKSDAAVPYIADTAEMIAGSGALQEQKKQRDALAAATKEQKKLTQSTELLRLAVLGGKNWGVSQGGGYGGARGHNGIDLPTPVGTQVYAPESGTVKAYGDNSSRGGKQLILIADSGKKYGFAHLDSYDVNNGSRVDAGMGIAKSGATGTRPNGKGYSAHLHLTVTDVNGKKVDPTNFKINKTKGGYDDTIGKYNEKVRSEEAKRLEEQLKLQAELRAKYGSEELRLSMELKKEGERILASGLPDAEIKSQIAQAGAEAKSKLAIYQKGLQDQLDAFTDYQKTERYLIEQARADAKFAAANKPELMRPENAQVLKDTLAAIDVKYDYDIQQHDLALAKQKREMYSFRANERDLIEYGFDEQISAAKLMYDELKDVRIDALTEEKQFRLDSLDLSQQKEALGLFEYASTERRMFEEGWRLKIAEAKLATDELKDIRIKAYEAEYAKDQELFNLNEKKKRLELNSYKMSDTEKMVAGIALEREGIALSNATPEQKREQSQAAGQPILNGFHSMAKGFDNSGTAEGNPYLALEAQHAENIEKIKAYEQELGLIERAAQEERLAAEREYYRAKAELVVNDGESIMGSLASIAKDTMGEQSGIFKAMFAMEKGFAIARSIMNIQVALSSAAASLPFPANLGAITTVAMEGASIISSLKAVAGTGFEKGGYTGNMGTSSVAGVVHGQEYVFDAQATKRIGVDNLNAMRSGQSVGGGDVNVTVNNHSSAKIETQKDDKGNIIMTIRDEVKRGFTELRNPNSYNAKMVQASFNTTVKR